MLSLLIAGEIKFVGIAEKSMQAYVYISYCMRQANFVTVSCSHLS